MTGGDYTGNISVANNGKQCEYWNETVASPFQQSLIEGINEAVYGISSAHTNQCRNVNQSRKPWCYTEEAQWAFCNIPYCGKLI